MNKSILIGVLAISLVSATVGSAYASAWGGGPFEGKLPAQSVNKSVTGKYPMWLKHAGSANAPVCGVSLCKTAKLSAQMPDGTYPLRAKVKP